MSRITNRKPISIIKDKVYDLTKVSDRVEIASAMDPTKRNTYYKLFMSDPGYLEAKKLYPLYKIGVLSQDVVKKYEKYFLILKSEGLVE